MSYPPRFDELHSVSDLHMGGPPGFQIFDQGEALAATIDHLRERPGDRRVVLVVNGDAVDFLAEAPALYLDPEGAVAKLERLFADDAFAPVWRALARYVRTPERWLALTLGNHDLELALPAVAERLVAELAGDDVAARGRVLPRLDGTGFLCRVGDARVLAVHGNEVDTWNWADHEGLRRVALAQHQGHAPEEWRPNAGTRLVVDVMNDVKKRHPMVDLLKPEDRVVVPMLLAIDPVQGAKIRRLAPTLLRLTTDTIRKATGFLSAGDAEDADAEPTPDDPDAAMNRLLGGALPTATAGSSVDELLDYAEAHLETGGVPAGRRTEMLGAGGLIWDVLRRRSPVDNLRDALRGWLAEDRTFDVTYEDSTFRLLDERVAPEIDFLLAGHTHNERAYRRRRSPGAYFNSGTWVRLIQLTGAMLDDDATFREIHQAFRAGTMRALDDFPDLVRRIPTVVSIWRDGDGVHGELRHAEVDAGEVTLRPVDGTRFDAR